MNIYTYLHGDVTAPLAEPCAACTSLSAAIGRDGLSRAFLNKYWTKFNAVFAFWTEGLVAVPTLVSTCF